MLSDLQNQKLELAAEIKLLGRSGFLSYYYYYYYYHHYYSLREDTEADHEDHRASGWAAAGKHCIILRIGSGRERRLGHFESGSKHRRADNEPDRRRLGGSRAGRPSHTYIVIRMYVCNYIGGLFRLTGR
jgi:hypothetical protein